MPRRSTFADALQQAGREALARLEETGEPALVLVGRPYNIFDRSVNCDIPRKLRTLYGINVLPMEVLPLDAEDISDVNPNMYWNSGRRILAAARIVRRYPNLHLVYISNFKCGPDSYIKSFVDEAAGKPSLVLQFDGHAQRRGLHHALRSVSRQQRISAMSLLPHRHRSRKIGADHPLSGKVGLRSHHGRRQPGSLFGGVPLAGSRGATHSALRCAHARIGRQIHHRR